MNTPIRIAMAAAAVVILAVIGVNLAPRLGITGGVGGVPTPRPTGAPMPTSGPVAPGTYRIDDPSWTPVGFTVTVPAGWAAREDGYVYKNSGQPDELGFETRIVTHVYADACNSAGTLTEVGPTVDDLVRALVDQVGSDASTPVDVTLGGFPAKRIDMSVPAELDTATCRYPGQLIQIWANPAENDFFAIPVDPANPMADRLSRVYIADVNGDRVVIMTGHAPGASTSDIAELQAIVDSIQMTP